MGTFLGHIAPGSLLFIYGVCLYIHSIVISALLSHPHTQTLVSPNEFDKKPALTNELPQLSKLLLNRKIACVAYLCASALAVMAGMVELVKWDWSWHHMTSPQHASMYGLVIMSAIIGLLTASNYLTSHSRWIVSCAFIVTGLMFYGHAQHGVFNTAVHQIVAYLLWAIGAMWLLHNVLTSACEEAVHQSVTTELQEASASVHISNIRRREWIISPTLASCTVITGRITGFLLILVGTWMYHIAFTLYSPFVDADIVHSDHDAHLLYMELSWYILFVAALGTIIEVAIRSDEQTSPWNTKEYAKLCQTAILDNAYDEDAADANSVNISTIQSKV